jgi:anhydro-N-acetylmuramic acid kinase
MRQSLKPLWTLGLMSGTSADGIDGALIQTDGITVKAFGPTHYVPYPERIRNQILKAYGRLPGPDEISLERLVTEHHAEVVFALLEKARMKASEVDLIGFHGQTLFHQPPQQKGERGETHILADGPFLASLTGIPVIDQFRLNDIAHGGQGAPLVPIFHQALSENLSKPIAILNIGGVANVTWIGARKDELLAFDTGPGNGLIDDWVRANTDLPWDEGGKIAASGQVIEDLLVKWLSHAYFFRKPPKSLDRKTFKAFLDDVKSLLFEDGIATLTAFTVACLEKAQEHFPLKSSLWLVAGGGTHNPTLLKMMKDRLNSPVQKAADKGWDGDALEAQAFGFLAVRSLRNLPLTFPGTTGAPTPLSGGRVCRPFHKGRCSIQRGLNIDLEMT